MSPNLTSQADPVILVTDTIQAFSRGDLDTCAARLTEQFLINYAGQPQTQGRETWLAGARMMREAFPDLTPQVLDAFGSGDRVALRIAFTGTHQGAFLGIEPTGRTIQYDSHEIYRVTGDQIAEEWICSDMGGLMMQLMS